MSDFIGRSMGRYHILEQLGEGGMATVFKAYDTRLERDAAVKIIRRDVFPPNQLENILKRFEREAKALARLTHSNIVSVIDYGEEDGTPYLVMEYLPGGTLKQRLGKPIPWQESIRLLLPIARALQFAHSQKIAHRDVKPSNILITLAGDPMLTDFGIAKILEAGEGQTLTGTGVGVGTPEYMAPEQWTGQSGPLSDQYSLGVVLYEMVTGRKPYVADTPAAVLLKQANDPLPRPSQFLPDLPEGVEKLLLKALTKNPEDRYPDMSSMVVAFENLLAGTGEDSQPMEKPIPAPAPIPVEGTLIAAVPQSVGPGTSSPKPAGGEPVVSHPPARRLRVLPFGIGAIALLVIAGAIFGISYLIRNKPVTNPPASTIAPTQTFTPMLHAGATWTRPADGMVMLYVPEGTFTMGRNDGENNEWPVHNVSLDGFWIDQTEVTNKMYELCVAADKCDPPNDSGSSSHQYYYGIPEFDDYPVIYVSWDDASAYCTWAGARLPSEAEWEKAARGTDGRTYPWGEEVDCLRANIGDCVGDTTKVGSYAIGKSPYGAYDMAGNVWEWVADWYDAYPGNPVSDKDYGTKYRVLRGGAWNDLDAVVRSSYRNRIVPMFSYNIIGFRCSRPVAVP